MYGTHVLLHMSVFLFFWAISDYFYTVYPPFGLVTRYTLVAAAVVYILLSISPLIFSNSPYNTPVTLHSALVGSFSESSSASFAPRHCACSGTVTSPSMI